MISLFVYKTRNAAAYDNRTKNYEFASVDKDRASI